jgi:hypothetical protein
MNKTIQYCLHMKTHTNIVEEDFENGTKKITTEKTKNQKKTYMDLLSKISKDDVSKEGLAIDISNTLVAIYDNYNEQLMLIQKLYNGSTFYEEKYIRQALKHKLNSYKQQDIKKTYDDYNNFITLENIIEKLARCSMLCFYCNVKTLILFKNARDDCQWTLDRINNYDEHSNNNTIICCLKCNLQRRRKNSAKFKFSKQLEHNLIALKKLE